VGAGTCQGGCLAVGQGGHRAAPRMRPCSVRRERWEWALTGRLPPTRGPTPRGRVFVCVCVRRVNCGRLQGNEGVGREPTPWVGVGWHGLHVRASRRGLSRPCSCSRHPAVPTPPCVGSERCSLVWLSQSVATHTRTQPTHTGWRAKRLDAVGVVVACCCWPRVGWGMSAMRVRRE
jgi:hypothetical protein